MTNPTYKFLALTCDPVEGQWSIAHQSATSEECVLFCDENLDDDPSLRIIIDTSNYASFPPVPSVKLEEVIEVPKDPTCSICQRRRTMVGMDAYDYNPIQVLTGKAVGWYSGEDGEICPEDMAKMLGRQQ